MDREGFRNRLKQYKEARGLNPLLKYWEWKAIPKYEEGTGNVQSANIPLWRQKATPELLEAFWTGDTQKMADIAEKQNQQVTYTSPEYTLDEVVVTAKDPNKYTEWDLAKDVASFTPGLGDAMDVYELGKSVYDGNYSLAVMYGMGLLLPNWLEKSGKVIYKTLRNANRPNLEFYAKLADDLILRPKETYSAYKKGLYPLTYKQRRNYLERVHRLDNLYRSILLRAIQDDISRRLIYYPGEPYVADKSYWVTSRIPDSGINSLSTVNGRSYNNFGNLDKNNGVNNPDFTINSHVALRESNYSNILRDPESVAGTLVHERQHSVSHNFPEFSYLTTFSPEAGYYVPSGYSIPPKDVTNILSSLNKNVINGNAWSSSPDEWFSNAMEYRVRFTDGKPYRDLSEADRQDFIDWMHALHGKNLSKDEIQRMLFETSMRGFADGGEVTDPQVEVLPKEQWPSPEEMYEQAKLPFNDLPLKNVFSPWDIALGTAYKAWPMVNNVFKNYGPTLGALMVGSDGTNMNKPLQQILTKKLDPDVKEFYNDIVLPLNPNDKKYKQYFINLFGDIDIQIDPTSNMPVNFAADFNPITNDIRLNANYIQTPMQQLLEAHEYGHLVDKYLPHKASTQQELNQSLPVSNKPISKDSDTYRERQSTKREAEFKTFKKLKDAGKLQLKTARAKTKKYQEYLMNATDEEILELLGADTAYKKDYLAGNLDIDTLRKQMIYAPTIAAGIIIPTHLLDSDKKENA